MKQTSGLQPIGDIRMDANQIVINPNDGYDLGLMSTAYPIKLHTDVTLDQFQNGEGYSGDGKILQANECKLGTVELNAQFLKKIGKPSKLVLCYDDGRLLLLPR